MLDFVVVVVHTFAICSIFVCEILRKQLRTDDVNIQKIKMRNCRDVNTIVGFHLQ